jgi:hypothetical protein
MQNQDNLPFMDLPYGPRREREKERGPGCLQNLTGGSWYVVILVL